MDDVFHQIMVTKNLCRQEVLVRCKTKCLSFLGPSLIFWSTNFFAAKVSSLRHQKPKKKAADPRNSDRLEFLTTLEEDEKILCFGVFCTQNVGFCMAVFVNIFCLDLVIWLDFFRHHLLQQSDFVKGNAIETCHPLLYIGTISSHGQTAIGQNCWQEGLLGPEYQIVASEVPQITLRIEL